MNPVVLDGATYCTTNALLTAAGSETLYDTTVSLQYCINGKAYILTAVTEGATPTTDVNTGAALNVLTANQGCIVVWGVDAAGTVKVAQGKIEALDSVTAAFKLTPQFPAIPDSIAPFAYQVLKADSTAGTITFGSSNWDATGFTNAIVNIFTLPNRNQAA